MLMKYWNLKLKIEKPSPKSARVFLSVERGIFDGYKNSSQISHDEFPSIYKLFLIISN